MIPALTITICALAVVLSIISMRLSKRTEERYREAIRSLEETERLMAEVKRRRALADRRSGS